MDLVKYSFENDFLKIGLSGRVETTNANEVEETIKSIVSNNQTENVVLDLADLNYISSAGLRVILRLRKDKTELKAVNASSDIYDIFEMTGFSEMMPIEKAYRQLSVDGCEVIGAGAKGTVYRYNPDTIVKVYKSLDSLEEIHKERELARKAFVLGVPTAISYDVVQVDGKYGSVFELLDANSFSQLIAKNPENLDQYVQDFAALLRTIHETPVKASDMPDAKEMGLKWIKGAEPYLEKCDAEKLFGLLDKVKERLTMLHCDYHTNNVMIQNGETLLIDMDTLSHGHPIYELANIFTAYQGFAEVDPEFVEKFMGFPAEIAFEFWKKLLPAYLETDDLTRINEVEKKTELLGYARVLRHYARRDGDPEKKQKIIDFCVGKIHTLLQEVDSLEF